LFQSAFRPRRISIGEPMPTFALERLAVIADRLDDAIGPVVGEADIYLH
jgi:hypothetical protein